ncbi:ATP-dependent DNA helicase RecG [Corynebacterium macclintockiae]|uniref:ATP-dependent DNA helicase RecG n=1 Tax=Corynebacterium macclintockiae TaxID=2913501 RepID=UPI003EB7CB24
MLGWQDPRPLSVAISNDRAKRLADKPGIKTIADAVLNFPTTYARLGSPQSLDELRVGGKYTCAGEILHATERENLSGRGPRKFLSFTFTDGVRNFRSALFGNVAYHRQRIKKGSMMLLHGKLSEFNGQWELKNPSYVSILPALDAEFGMFGPLKTIVDVMGSETAAQELLAKPWMAGYKRRPGTSTAEMLGVMDHVLRVMDEPGEFLPLPRRNPGAPAWPVDGKGRPLISFADALRHIHQPTEAGPEPARRRLKFNEALELQLVMALRRSDATKRTGVALAPGENVGKLIAGLPFDLSAGQKMALEDIGSRLGGTTPANLLLHGEVGSGKTMVALISMLWAVDSGYQCAFIAPTEILAVQHARNLVKMLENTDVRVSVLVGSQKQADKQRTLLDLVSGQTDILVGTHAVIQDSVEFYRLGMVIVDEQHRFGVEQRNKLRESAPVDATPHMMVMTATPIPRSVGMTMFGDLTPITLVGKPGGRGDIETVVVPADKYHWVRRAWQRMREEIDAGGQAYVVAPRIDGYSGVEQWSERIATQELPGCSVAMLHGKMDAADKDQVMQDFAAGKIDVLVATTVIEVGVDVPNASMMMILEAENFGFSQLHQLRGRIGRGRRDSLCLLHTTAAPDSPSFHRLQVVADSNDGFRLAEEDLKMRTEGDILGEDQSGRSARRASLLDLSTDGEIIESARDYAEALVAYDEQLARSLVVDIEIDDQDYIEKS